MDEIIRAVTGGLPVPSRLITVSQLVDITGARAEHITELVELEWMEPVSMRHGQAVFKLRDAYRLKKLTRIMRDLEVSTLAASVIVDLLDRVDHLEARVAELKRLAR